MTGPAGAGGPTRGIVGRTCPEHGRPVLILVQWGTRANGYRGPAGGPRDVPVRRADGSTTIRPFGGLRLPRAGR